MLTMRQIEAFRAVMLTTNMTEAGRMLSVTQSAISKIMRELEEEVGFSLFARRKGGLEPTPDAFALFEEVQRSFSGLDKIARAARRIRHREGGRLRIAAMPALTSGFLQMVVRSFAENGHDAEVSVDTYNSPEVVDLVAAGHYDVGFAMTPVDTEHVMHGPVMSVNCVCLVPEGHPLCQKSVVSIKDLEGEAFISLAEATTTRLKIDGLFASENIIRSKLYEARWSVSVASFVAEGLGCAIIEPFSAKLFRANGVKTIPMEELISFSFVDVTPKPKKPNLLTTDFVKCFRDHLYELYSNESNRPWYNRKPRLDTLRKKASLHR